MRVWIKDPILRGTETTSAGDGLPSTLGRLVALSRARPRAASLGRRGVSHAAAA